MKSILCVLAILMAFRVPVVGQVVSRPLTLQELVLARSKLSTQMIPAYSDFFNVQNKQAFALPGPGNESTWLVPVFYNAKAEQGGGEQCGIFAIRSSGAVNFTETFGPEIYKGKFGPDTNINVNCDHLQAIGFMAASQGKPPRLVLSIAASMLASIGDRESIPWFLVFDWDTAAGHYSLNKSLSDALYKTKASIGTVPQAKRFIQAHEAK